MHRRDLAIPSLVALWSAFAPLSASARHSFGMFDDKLCTTLAGRITVESDTAMTLWMTSEDPEGFTSPFTFDTKFIKVPVSCEVGCAANNRDNGTTFGLTPPEDD